MKQENAKEKHMSKEFYRSHTFVKFGSRYTMKRALEIECPPSSEIALPIYALTGDKKCVVISVLESCDGSTLSSTPVQSFHQ